MERRLAWVAFAAFFDQLKLLTVSKTGKIILWSLTLPDLRSAFPGAFVLGIDRAQRMLQLAPRAVPLAVMDARQLALPPTSVDLVLFEPVGDMARREIGSRTRRAVEHLAADQTGICATL